jgi:hypothetical protein
MEQMSNWIKEMEQRFCQSCGMPMMSAEQFGTNADGSQT